jgi:hypothetical protein
MVELVIRSNVLRDVFLINELAATKPIERCIYLADVQAIAGNPTTFDVRIEVVTAHGAAAEKPQECMSKAHGGAAVTTYRVCNADSISRRN